MTTEEELKHLKAENNRLKKLLEISESAEYSRLNIKDLVNVEQLKGLFDKFSSLTGYTVGFVQQDTREVLISSGWTDICKNYHRSFESSESICKESNAKLTKNLLELHQVGLHECQHGMIDGATPIIIDGQHLADIFSGQALFHQPNIESFKQGAKEFGYDTESYLKALQGVKVTSEEKLKEVLDFLSYIAKMVAELGKEKKKYIRLNNSLESIINDRTKELQQLNIKLKENQQTYLHFFEHSKSANIIYTTNDNGETFVVDKVNVMLEQMEGLNRDDIVGEKLHKVFKGAEKSGIFDIFKKVYRTGQAYHFPTAKIEYNHKNVWREHYIFKLPSDELVASYIDRTTEKELEFQQINNYEKTLLSFVELIEQRDTYTGGHSLRVAHYSKMVAQEMGYSEAECKMIYQAGILHDIGKITTPDAILLKPGGLNKEEYELIQSHVQNSADILRKIPMYSHLADIVLAHHERFDGSGYPQGLKGDAIPPFARIMSACDAFDAMTTNRIYKGRKSVDEALSELQSLVGVHYEEAVIDAARKVLSTLALDKDVSQFPDTQLEKKRFAYFFNDQVTGVYNQNYLSIILQRNCFEYKYVCLNIIFMKNFTQYNERFGWKGGDELLKTFGEFLQEKFPCSLIFRLHGDDFIIINEKHYEIDIKKIECSADLTGSKISLSQMHFHIKNDEINTIESLEDRLQTLL